MKLFVNFLFCSAVLTSKAQAKIDGMGPFKIGKSLSSNLPSYADTSKGRLFYAETDIPGTEMWYAGYYPIAGLWVENISLYFYKDTLCKIECLYFKIADAIKLKYGEGVVKYHTEKPIVCQNGYGNKFDKMESFTVKAFPTATKRISAEATSSTFYDSKCQPEFISKYAIYDSYTMNLLNKVNGKAKEEKDKAAVDAKKKSLESF